MNELLAFFMAFVISFWGSLQLGPVNVCVIQTAMAHGKRQALIVATGGALPEIIYASLAAWGATFIAQNTKFLFILGWVIIGLLFALGLYYFLKPYSPLQVKPSKGAGFIKGFVLAIFNPQLLPFWLGVLVYLNGFIDFSQGTLFSPYIAFVLGTACGAWFLLFVFTKLTLKYKLKLNNLLKHNMNKIVGGLFIFLAIIELCRRLSDLI
jgi:threonine/homoserine/homoserine lactone efflux protein